ncbi:MAG: aldolase/citrate lyase family protein [Saprospiraceae bacterium]
MQNIDSKIGTIISTDLPQISAYLFSFGYDFIFIDLEHGNVSTTTIQSIVKSKQNNSQIFIRIREISESAIKYALDLGCDGIIAPRVENIEELKALIQYSNYPPIGKRSLGFSMANDYGLNLNNYLQNYKPILIPQIESVAGMGIAKELIQNNQVDGILVGPYDLSLSLGIPGEFNNPIFIEAYESIRKLCFENKKYFCAFCSNVESAKEEINKGVHYLTIGIDMNIILNTYKESISLLKKLH